MNPSPTWVGSGVMERSWVIAMTVLVLCLLASMAIALVKLL
jgi:hypothetical protein